MNARPGRSDLLLALAGVVGLALFVILYREVTPQAAVSLEVTREEARASAVGFIEELGSDPSPLRSVSRFSASSTSFLFLERTLGLQEASRWARQVVPIWAWQFRWFQPQEKEEWTVRIGLDGTPVRLEHLVDEAASGADLEPEEAQVIAEDFVGRQGWDLSEWELVEASVRKRDNRTDHSFTWEKAGSEIVWQADDPEAGEGSVRLRVEVLGDRVGGYSHFLKVPERFERELEGTLSLGAGLTVGSLVLIVVLALLALGIAIARTRRDGVRWKPALVLGGVTGALFLLQQLTGWRLAAFAYPTSISWTLFLSMLLAGVLLLSVLYGLFVVIPAAAGESLARETFPQSLTAYLDVMRSRFRTSGVAAASLRGYALGFGFLGYLTVFYVLARRFAGAWLPAEGPYGSVFDYALPFLTPLTISLVAAVSEEVVFRLFGISLIRRYFKSTALALLIPAVIWAFAHSSYPVFPVYVRGIELTIGGVLFGLAFLRMGLLTCIVGHYVVDAVLIGMPLLTSGSAYYAGSGVVVVALALVPAALALVARREHTGSAPTPA